MHRFIFALAVSGSIFAEGSLEEIYLKALQESRMQAPSFMENLLDRMFVDNMLSSPESATDLGFFEPLGLHAHNRYLSDLTEEESHKEMEKSKEYRALLQQIPDGELTADELLTKQVVLWQLDQEIEGEKFFYHSYLINQLFGMTHYINNLFASLHPLSEEEDKEAFLIRLPFIAKKFDQVIHIMQEQRARGFFPPRFAIAKALGSLQMWNAIPIEEHPFYQRLPQENVKEVLETSVFPAYCKLQAFLEGYLVGLEREDGVWALPDGDAYYEYMLKRNTTLDLTAEEVHAIGLAEVARVSKEIRREFAKLGIIDEEASVGKLLCRLGEDPQYYFPNTDEGRALCLKEFEAILDRSRKELGPLFPLKPKASLSVVRVPPHEEKSSAAAYYMGPSRNGREGQFFANLGNMNDFPRYSMETLAIHEGEPGHHYQIGVEIELDIHPLRQLCFNCAYVEGWALYAEKLAYEQGFYSTPAQVIGHLQDELWRAARLVVDTGIHKMRWTREQAIAYMCQTVGKKESQVVSEVERYFVLPGQACSYKMGQLKLLELRKEAMEELGEQFDIGQFHVDMIKEGVLPLNLLLLNQRLSR